ncbi:MAG: L7Ae/L30e/S12e/Gadd45 family ribosomal protein [Bacillota bacterium]
MKGLLGLAQRAGKLSSGDDVVRRRLGKSRYQLLLLARDASPRTKEIREIAAASGCPIIEFATKNELGAALGKPDRAVILIEDRGFIERALSLVGEREQGQ